MSTSLWLGAVYGIDVMCDCRNSSHVLVITAEGLFQLYAIDLENGGECALIREFQ